MRVAILPALALLLQDSRAEPYWLGWYHPLGEPEALEGLSRTGCTLMRGGFDHKNKRLDSNKPEIVKAYLDAAAASKVKVLLHAPATFTAKGEWDKLKRWIGLWKDHPAILGWYLFDEPEVHRVKPDRLLEAYRLVKSIDPDRPVAVCFAPINEMKSIDEFQACYDLLIFNYYPCRGSGEFPAALKGWAGVLDRIVKKARDYRKRGAIMVLQGFQDSGTRVPTRAEARYLLYSTAIRDTIGALFFCDGWCPPRTKKEINELIRELAAIPVRQGKFMDPSVACTSPAVRYRLMKNHLIAVNESDGDVEARFTLPKKEVEVVGESRRLTGAERFSRYQVRIYRWE
jgi:hypothetical protein